MKSKEMIITAVMAVLIEAGSITAYATEQPYLNNGSGEPLKVASEYKQETTKDDSFDSLFKAYKTGNYEKIRLSGADKYDTAIQISNEFVRGSSIGGDYRYNYRMENGKVAYDLKPTDITNSFTKDEKVVNCIIINDSDKATAIGSVPLSVYLNAPVLLTGKESLNEKTQAQLEKLQIKNVYIAGGIDKVSESVEQQLKSLGYKVTRYGGKTSIETNRIMMKAIPQSLWGINPKIVNEDDWVQGASVAMVTKYYYMKTNEVYINPIFLVPANTSTASELKDIADLLKPVRDSWENKKKDLYEVGVDLNIRSNYMNTLNIGKDRTTVNSKLRSFYSQFYNSNGIYSSYKQTNTKANIIINSSYENTLRNLSLHYRVKASLLCNGNNIDESLSVPAISAKYAMPIVFAGKPALETMGYKEISDSQLDNLFKQVYEMTKRVYYIGGTDNVPDGSESILNGQ